MVDVAVGERNGLVDEAGWWTKRVVTDVTDVTSDPKRSKCSGERSVPVSGMPRGRTVSRRAGKEIWVIWVSGDNTP